MKFTKIQFEAAAYIFEKTHGNKKGDYEEKIISKSGLSGYPLLELEQKIVDGLNSQNYETSKERTAGYWALSKRFNKLLTKNFKNWLRKELELNEPFAVYQLMIALENLDEPVFNPNRQGSSASDEIEKNMSDARVYLKSADQNSANDA
ncbi:MAG: hypothetical protein OEU76_06535 [Cyclobacteriaceae bacterium]|nr:hypothetical protein [Cyclobacteriaceae bacterium]